MGSKDQMKRSKVDLEDSKRCKECQFDEPTECIRMNKVPLWNIHASIVTEKGIKY